MWYVSITPLYLCEIVPNGDLLATLGEQNIVVEVALDGSLPPRLSFVVRQ